MAKEKETGLIYQIFAKTSFVKVKQFFEGDRIYFDFVETDESGKKSLRDGKAYMEVSGALLFTNLILTKMLYKNIEEEKKRCESGGYPQPVWTSDFGGSTKNGVISRHFSIIPMGKGMRQYAKIQYTQCPGELQKNGIIKPVSKWEKNNPAFYNISVFVGSYAELEKMALMIKASIENVYFPDYWKINGSAYEQPPVEEENSSPAPVIEDATVKDERFTEPTEIEGVEEKPKAIKAKDVPVRKVFLTATSDIKVKEGSENFSCTITESVEGTPTEKSLVFHVGMDYSTDRLEEFKKALKKNVQSGKPLTFNALVADNPKDNNILYFKKFA